MITLGLSSSQGRPRFGLRRIFLTATLGVASLALATPPVGFILNQILAKGVISDNISENIQIVRDQNGKVNPWGVVLQTHGATDFYMQHLVLTPGGYSGWHVHPGLLIGTLTGGSVDFYDENCNKKTIHTGDVYFETGTPHAIINNDSVNADLSISYLIKHDAPRRVEADAPACAVNTPIP